ncbi:glycosyltransferase family 2 protein [Ichthyenterobacterium sp. W332]|uniref:Glycosyltransferase family 2 protein n=1 Tax=Microcosmobacter mediterraneus TaxID=3075607 RepID=A0ABU2YKD4_9FLAO|nr:glycosyltransferase family 2 protein [Ichthyenterobacterium sp. W332]MDT0558636.1 glycosyltransferase family 2 protein [Ichthyenterobacterium sp. W332]
MTIAVVILNWNGKTLLEQFLPSVVAFSKEARIYVADNASTDDSITFLETHYPDITVIENLENGGYAKGYNDALKHINEDIICLLNSDVEVTKNWLIPILRAYNTDPETAIIQPMILDFITKEKFEYAGAAGGYIDKYGYPFCRGRIFNTIEDDTNQYGDAEIFWASGACFFIKNEVFKTLGGFDESFFAHMEEIDLCWRAHNNNLKVNYISEAVVYHVGGATLLSTNPKKTYLNFRNSLFTMTKNAYGNLFLLIFTRLVLDGLAAIQFLVKFKLEFIWSILKAHLSFYKNLSRLLKQRKSATQLPNYFKTKSIVYQYYLKGKTEFNRL